MLIQSHSTLPLRSTTNGWLLARGQSVAIQYRHPCWWLGAQMHSHHISANWSQHYAYIRLSPSARSAISIPSQRASPLARGRSGCFMHVVYSTHCSRANAGAVQGTKRCCNAIRSSSALRMRDLLPTLSPHNARSLGTADHHVSDKRKTSSDKPLLQQPSWLHPAGMVQARQASPAGHERNSSPTKS